MASHHRYRVLYNCQVIYGQFKSNFIANEVKIGGKKHAVLFNLCGIGTVDPLKSDPPGTKGCSDY